MKIGKLACQKVRSQKTEDRRVCTIKPKESEIVAKRNKQYKENEQKSTR